MRTAGRFLCKPYATFHIVLLRPCVNLDGGVNVLPLSRWRAMPLRHVSSLAEKHEERGNENEEDSRGIGSTRAGLRSGV